jgi:hypothetical protein
MWGLWGDSGLGWVAYRHSTQDTQSRQGHADTSRHRATGKLMTRLCRGVDEGSSGPTFSYKNIILPHELAHCGTTRTTRDGPRPDPLEVLTGVMHRRYCIHIRQTRKALHTHMTDTKGKRRNSRSHVLLCSPRVVFSLPPCALHLKAVLLWGLGLRAALGSRSLYLQQAAEMCWGAWTRLYSSLRSSLPMLRRTCFCLHCAGTPWMLQLLRQRRLCGAWAANGKLCRRCGE